MIVEITITIEANEEDFDKSELRSDILYGFPETTGYDIKQLDIKKE
jgi:hypothetical protein